MTKKFQVEKRGKLQWVVIRQAPHDPQYKLGSHIPSYGKVVAVIEAQPATCAACGATQRDIQAGAAFLNTDDPICCEVNF